MTRKTETLAYPANPLAAMRELQELNNPETITGGSESDPDRVPLPVVSTTRIEVGSATSSVVSRTTTLPRRHQLQTTETETGSPESNRGGNPLTSAMREMLGQPYTAEPRKRAYTVSTVKIPTEVWERLGWAAMLTERPKQEIIAEALKDYFAKLVGGR
jgi:hypothetical protein